MGMVAGKEGLSVDESDVDDGCPAEVVRCVLETSYKKCGCPSFVMLCYRML